MFVSPVWQPPKAWGSTQLPAFICPQFLGALQSHGVTRGGGDAPTKSSVPLPTQSGYCTLHRQQAAGHQQSAAYLLLTNLPLLFFVRDPHLLPVVVRKSICIFSHFTMEGPCLKCVCLVEFTAFHKMYDVSSLLVGNERVYISKVKFGTVVITFLKG